MKPRGRPRIDADDPTVQTSLRLSAKQFDASQKQAHAERMTMAEWIRKLLADGISHPKNRT